MCSHASVGGGADACACVNTVCIMCVAVCVCVCVRSHILPSDSRHLQSAPNKAFQHVKVDTLCQPEAMSSVAVPGEW